MHNGAFGVSGDAMGQIHENISRNAKDRRLGVTSTMPNEVKAYVSAAVAIVAHLGALERLTGAWGRNLMILAMWIFPEAGRKEKIAKRR
jgi:hypothetical protein